MIFKKLSAALVGIVMAVSFNANASVIYEQEIDLANTWGHNPFKSVFGYDDFTLGVDSTINKITINAHAIWGNDDVIGSLSWEIRSFSGVTPGNLLFSGTENTVTQFDTGLNSYTWDLIDYSINVNSFNLTAGSYWLGIKANSAGNVHWTGTYGDVNLSQALKATTTPGQYVSYLTNRSDTVFRLENNVTVPEPSTIAIFALGIMGLASRKFKKKCTTDVT